MLDLAAQRLLEEDTFSLWCPSGLGVLVKAGDSTIDEETRPIGGFASTETLDRQGEICVQKGLDFSEFVAFGYFNDNHKQETAAVLGVPRLAELRKGRWYTEGNLLKGFGPADRVWELAKALHKSRLDRKLGFSIEGKIIQRGYGNKILKAKIRNVAITNAPVNTDCNFDIITKAFATETEIDKFDSDYRRALSTNTRALIPESLEGGAPRILTVDEAVERLQKLRPHFSKAVCERIVRLAMKTRS